MRKTLSAGCALLLLLGTSVAVAGERDAVVRNIYLSDHPRDTASPVYVRGQVATVLRFEKACDPQATKLLGWEGRFEPPVIGGRSVLLLPLQDLEPEDRLPLRVMLTDGTEVPFIVTARDGLGDQQVNVFPDRKSTLAVHAALTDALNRERALRRENDRYRKEETSADHALAALLASGSTQQTPFIERQKWVLRDGEMEMVVRVYAGKAKAAVVFHITNPKSERPWSLMEARLSTASSGEARPFALRMDQDSIAPGASGRLAVVADRSAFKSGDGFDNLELELFRHDGLRHAYVLLDHRLARELKRR
ncbi:DUF2381 family protein [Myxococcus sp. RHSTA-1-4]|uniref:DUF2381 family protein n=1 Tax=Myxococcus sp. RHSTA-1-4 TaxID=2874601 RepID=UPI001CC1C11D|nr:DUF2381 family protein [Myxococcus sp. RHSTA-1-4]MBZ4419780.1 DUF2381 family protein [Myxococcus sp. RHSTA-1-4]